MSERVHNSILIPTAISVFILTALIVTGSRLSKPKDFSQQAKAETTPLYNRYQPAYGMGPCDVRYKVPPEGSTLKFKSETAFQLNFNCRTKVPLTSLKIYVYRNPVSISDDSTRVTLLSKSLPYRGDGKYCFFGRNLNGTCKLWNNFLNQPDIPMQPPDPKTGLQGPGYKVHTDFCYSGNYGCWYYTQSFWIQKAKIQPLGE